MIDKNILCNNKKIQDECKEIYKKHSDALTILQNYTDNTEDIMKFCKDFLKNNGFVDILTNSNSNTQFYFLSQNLFDNALKGNTLKNATEIKFCYRIMKENLSFEKALFFKKGEATDLQPWQSDFLATLGANTIFTHNEQSQRRGIIVDSSIVHGIFDDAAKADLTSKLEDFVKEIEAFENSVANIQIL